MTPIQAQLALEAGKIVAGNIKKKHDKKKKEEMAENGGKRTLPQKAKDMVIDNLGLGLNMAGDGWISEIAKIVSGPGSGVLEELD